MHMTQGWLETIADDDVCGSNPTLPCTTVHQECTALCKASCHQRDQIWAVSSLQYPYTKGHRSLVISTMWIKLCDKIKFGVLCPLSVILLRVLMTRCKWYWCHFVQLIKLCRENMDYPVLQWPRKARRHVKIWIFWDSWTNCALTLSQR